MLKKKVAFIIYSLNKGGAENVITNVINYLSQKNDHFEIFIITISNNNIDYYLNANVKVIELNQSKDSTNLLNSITNNFKRIVSIRNKLKELNIEIVVSFMTTTNIISTFAAKSLGIPIIVSERINPEFSYGKFWDILKKIAYNKVDYLVVQTKGSKTVYENSGYKSKIEVIPNALSKTIKENYNQFTKQNIILNVGRLVEQKGQHILIDAFKSCGLYENYKLIIVGIGPLESNLRKQIIDNNLQDKVILIGQIQDLTELYSSASLFVLSSLYEGYPNALLEALSFGLPCISFNCPYGPSDIIKNNINGVLIELNSNKVNNLANSMRSLLNNKELIEKLSSNAKIINETNSEANINEKWLKLINILNK